MDQQLNLEEQSVSTIFVAGHAGMVGSAIYRKLEERSVETIVTATRAELDLADIQVVEPFLQKNQVKTIYLAAAKVGGIHANNEYPADFIRDNLQIQLSVIEAAHQAGVNRLLFLGSSCIYPRLAAQPMAENALLSGTLEPTNEPYAIAKIAGIKLCESYNRQYGRDYRAVMPTNLYGVNDNFHLENSHVVPALIRRFHEAKLSEAPEVVVWGSGTPKREFLYVDDLADACIHVMNITRSQYESVTSPMESHINVGTGVDCTIAELATTIAKVVGYKGDIAWDVEKPDGAPRKLLNVEKISSLGWRANTSLDAGLTKTYRWFCDVAAEGVIRGP